MISVLSLFCANRSIMKYLMSYDNLIKNQWEPSPYIATSTDMESFLFENEDYPSSDEKSRILGLGLFLPQNKLKSVIRIFSFAEVL